MDNQALPSPPSGPGTGDPLRGPLRPAWLAQGPTRRYGYHQRPLGIALFLVLLGAVGTLGEPLLATVMFLGFFRYGLNGIYELTSSAGLQTASGITSCLIFALSLYDCALALSLEEELSCRF